MIISITPEKVEELVRAHVQASFSTVVINPGKAELGVSSYGEDSYFNGFSFSISPKKAKFEEIKEMILKMNPDHKIASIKEIRDLSANFTAAEVGSFPKFYRTFTHTTAVEEVNPTTGGFSLTYAKMLAEKIWREK